MAVYRRGAVTVRIDEAKMRKYVEKRADLAAARGSYAIANHVQAVIRERNLIDKGTLLKSISVQKGGRGAKIGAWYRVFTDASSSPYAGMQHSGAPGTIKPKNGPLLYLKSRRNSRKNSNRVWVAKSVKGYVATPFMKLGTARLTVQEMVQGVGADKPVKSNVAKAAGGFTKALQSGALKGGRY